MINTPDTREAMPASARYKCAPTVTSGPGEVEPVLFDSRDGSYHALNASAAQIWLELSNGLQPEDIAEVIGSRHGINPALVAPDIAEFVERACRMNLLVAE